MLRLLPHFFIILLFNGAAAMAADSTGVTINQEHLARIKATAMPKFDRSIPFDTLSD